MSFATPEGARLERPGWLASIPKAETGRRPRRWDIWDGVRAGNASRSDQVRRQDPGGPGALPRTARAAAPEVHLREAVLPAIQHHLAPEEHGRAGLPQLRPPQPDLLPDPAGRR